MKVTAAHAVAVKRAGVLVDGGGTGGEEAGIPEGGEIFCGVETEGGGVAETACGERFPNGAEGLCGVLDEEEFRGLCLKGGEAVPVCALTVEVDGEDRSYECFRVGAGSLDGFACGGRGEIEGEGVDVGEDGACSDAEDGAGRGEEAER